MVDFGWTISDAGLGCLINSDTFYIQTPKPINFQVCLNTLLGITDNIVSVDFCDLVEQGIDIIGYNANQLFFQIADTIGNANPLF
ncbi:MAG: hypothetical protein R2728_05040 [Chitinophagales bacterium]